KNAINYFVLRVVQRPRRSALYQAHFCSGPTLDGQLKFVVLNSLITWEGREDAQSLYLENSGRDFNVGQHCTLLKKTNKGREKTVDWGPGRKRRLAIFITSRTNVLISLPVVPLMSDYYYASILAILTV
ncbi:hypothetical protein AVEN_213792-1, partial [Araneus ventricosus]